MFAIVFTKETGLSRRLMFYLVGIASSSADVSTETKRAYFVKYGKSVLLNSLKIKFDVNPTTAAEAIMPFTV
jgi:hypothetical protein